MYEKYFNKLIFAGDTFLPGTGTGCSHTVSFNALTGLSCYALAGGIALSSTAFQCPLGLELLLKKLFIGLPALSFNALSGLSCYFFPDPILRRTNRFNALSGLSCYCKNVQYFKFFMILFMHTCYL